MIKKNIKREIESSNISFLVGAGLSRPFLDTLNSIELDLTDAEKKGDQERIVQLKKDYFSKSILGNLKILRDEVDAKKDKVLNDYENFYKAVNYLLLNRADSILTKQVNIFTTNIDIFSEKALEKIEIDFNDGFSGRFNPKYNIGNFKKSYYKKSLHYENTSEIPVFNIIKLHGSLSWQEKDNNIFLDKNLDIVDKVDSELSTVNFGKIYDHLMIVNPTKKKWADTVLDRRYYDLLRVYSNELEKENSLLFVMGFSFADEHICDLTLQVANANPTLKIYIFSHSSNKDSIFDALESSAKNKNIIILYPNKGSNFDLEAITNNYFISGALDKEDGIEESF